MRRAGFALALLLGLIAPACADPAAKFDYYLLSLSWSPSFCESPAGAREPRQCGVDRRYAFVVHGLWPQYERGFPRDCPSTQPADVPASLVNKQLDIMPSPKLVEHEWDSHGTCSGLSQTTYFDTLRKTRAKVVVPPVFVAPAKALNVSAADVRAAFLKANPGMKPDGLAIDCDHNKLREVRVCFTKAGAMRSCSASVRDRCEGRVRMPPIRRGAG